MPIVAAIEDGTAAELNAILAANPAAATTEPPLAAATTTHAAQHLNSGTTAAREYEGTKEWAHSRRNRRTRRCMCGVAREYEATEALAGACAA